MLPSPKTEVGKKLLWNLQGQSAAAQFRLGRETHLQGDRVGSRPLQGVATVALRQSRPRRAGVRPNERVGASVAPLCTALPVAARGVPPSTRVQLQFLMTLGIGRRMVREEPQKALIEHSPAGMTAIPGKRDVNALTAID